MDNYYYVEFLPGWGSYKLYEIDPRQAITFEILHPAAKKLNGDDAVRAKTKLDQDQIN